MKPPDRRIGTTRRWTRRRLAGAVVKSALPLLVLAAVGIGFELLRASKPEVPRRPPVERSWSVRTVPAEPGRHQPRITAYGTVLAGRQVALRVLVAGEVVAVGEGLREGGTVEAGDPLVTIDDFSYRGAVIEARANLAEARARLVEAEARVALETAALESLQKQLALAERDLERAETLSGTGAMSAQSLEARRLTVIQRRQAVTAGGSSIEIARAQVAQLEAQIDRLEWKLSEAEHNLEDVVLAAPFDAYVATADAEVGKLLNVNDVVAVLHDRNWFEVRFTLTDAEYGRLIGEGLIGRPVEVLWHVGGSPHRYAGRIDRVAAEIAAERGGLDVYARIESAEGEAPLRPGAFVEVSLDDRAYENVVRVPATAVYGTDRLYVVEDGRLAGRTVEIVGYAGDDVLVRGDLARGEPILVTRITEAGDGLKVIEETVPAARNPVPAAGSAADG